MRIPLLDSNGIVTNIVIADDAWQPPDGVIRGAPGGEIGDTWNGTAYTRPPKPEPPLSADDFANAIQNHVDATAKSKGYADGIALAGYSTSTIPAWSAEAQTFIAWRDQVWLYAYTELAKVQGGQREVPTIAELVGELPTINWP